MTSPRGTPASPRTGAAAPLDCSRPATALFWAFIGSTIAVAALLVQQAPNAASLLRVGSSNPLLASIERDLGPISSPDAVGHDGQLYYLIARDPFATGATVAALAAFDTNPPRYRYRRILVPLLAGGFGRFSGRTTLFEMIACTVLGLALTAVGIADLAFKLGLPGRAAILAIFNLGAIVSVMLLTADVTALGLSLAGVALLVRRHDRTAVLLLALAGLAKETYLLVPLALAAWQWREHRRSSALSLAAIPLVPVIAWSLWLAFAIPDIPKPTANLGLPMVGMLQSMGHWTRPGALDGIQLTFALYAGASFLIAAAMLAAGRNVTLRWVLAPWVILGCLASEANWGIPSNIARSLSILWPLGVLLAFDRLASARSGRIASRDEVQRPAE